MRSRYACKFWVLWKKWCIPTPAFRTWTNAQGNGGKKKEQPPQDNQNIDASKLLDSSFHQKLTLIFFGHISHNCYCLAPSSIHQHNYRSSNTFVTYPSFLHSSTTTSRESCVLAASTRRHFRDAYWRESSRPIPDEAPVITITELTVERRIIFGNKRWKELTTFKFFLVLPE